MWRTRHITGCSGLSCLPEKAHRLCSIVFYNTLRILTVVSCVFACKHSWLLEWISPPFSKKKREKKQHVIGCYEAYFEGEKKHILGISENRIISYLKIWTSISHKIQKRCDWCVNPWTLTARVFCGQNCQLNQFKTYNLVFVPYTWPILWKVTERAWATLSTLAARNI